MTDTDQAEQERWEIKTILETLQSMRIQLDRIETALRVSADPKDVRYQQQQGLVE